MKRSMNLWIALITATCLLTAFDFTGAFASDYLSVLKERGKVIVGTSADYPPYESMDDDGNFIGFDIDLIREIGKRMGLEVVIKDMPFDTLIAAIQNKKIDLLIAALQGSSESDKRVDFSNPYNFINDAIIIPSDSNTMITTAWDAAGKKIGVQVGTTHDKWVTDNLIKAGLTKEDQLIRYERVDNASLDLAAGRIDILLIQSKRAKDMVNKLKKLKIALITAETVFSGQCIALPEGETVLKSEIDRILVELKNDSWIGKKVAEWEFE